MDTLEFVLKGIGMAVLAGVIGVIVLGAIEVAKAYHDPVHREVLSHRTWRENLHKMLH